MLITVLGSWPFRTWDSSDHNREFPVDGLLVHCSWGRCKIHPDLLQNHLPGRDPHRRSHGPKILGRDQNLAPVLFLFRVSGLSGLFLLLPAFYLPPFVLSLLIACSRS